MELLFHTGESLFYRDGVLQEEPEETLEELLKQYDEACDAFLEFKKRQREAAKDHVRTRWIHGTEPEFIEDTKRNYAHRTWANAEWSDITLAIASDMSSPGELTTKKAAGPRYVGYQLPPDFAEKVEYTNPRCRMADEVIAMIMEHPHFRKDGLRLNIAGNSQISLDRAGITTNQVRSLLSSVLNGLRQRGVSFAEIRSGGQTGVDEAGIKAAQDLGIRCSILAPKGFRMHYEDGVELEGREQFTDRFREQYIEMEAWQKDEESFSWGLADFNGFNAIDMLEFEIDLKIMHINARNRVK